MGKHDATLLAIFTRPTRANIRWRDIESLLKSLGAKVFEREGFRVAVELNGVVAVFHRPHPSPQTNRATVKDVRDLLSNAGMKP